MPMRATDYGFELVFTVRVDSDDVDFTTLQRMQLVCPGNPASPFPLSVGSTNTQAVYITKAGDFTKTVLSYLQLIYSPTKSIATNPFQIVVT